MSVKSIVSLVLLIIVGALLFDAIFIVHERERALLLRFGEAVRVYSDDDAGLHFKWPIAEEVRRFDGRILTVDTPAQRYFTLEKETRDRGSFRQVAGRQRTTLLHSDLRRRTTRHESAGRSRKRRVA